MAKIEVYIPEEDSNLKGITRARIEGRTINNFRFFREKVKDLDKLNLEEIGLNNNGVYILKGENEEGIDLYYIGQSYDIISRMKNHTVNKDFFSEIILFTSNEFNPTSILDLESMMINKAIDNSIKLENKKPEKEQKIDIAIKEQNRSYFKDIKILCSILGLNIFDDKITKKEEKEIEKKGEIFYCNNSRGAEAKGYFNNGGILVLEGSIFTKEIVNSFGSHNKKMKQNLIDSKILIEDNNLYKLTKNYFFKSPSLASSIILGNPSNGWTGWKNKNNKTLNEIYRNID